jgi:HEAT repeat protein
MRTSNLAICVVMVFVWGVSSLLQAAQGVESPRHRAWDMLVTAAFSQRTSERTDGVRALGLLRDNFQARQLAEYALTDSNSDVRRAAATALGQMHAKESIPKLESALSDEKIPVVMAAAQSLRELKADKSAYGVYYDLLTGERKAGDGLIAKQLAKLRDPKQLAEIGVSEGIGFVPFAGIGWDVWRTVHTKDPNPVRAVAATLLAHDPDPASGDALVKATNDKDWIVRAAAIEAIAQRGDASLLPHVVEKFSDKNTKVRFSAAAAVIRLSAIDQRKTARNDR